MRKLTFLLTWLVLWIPCSAKIIYVDVDASGSNDGSIWADAYNYLQDALFSASSGAEIRVAEGTYKPDQFVLSDRPNLGRMETFQLKNGVTIKGGYAGFGEPDPDARDIKGYETILSGDINGDDVSVSDPCDMRTEPARAENSFHVVTGILTDTSAVLDGFTISSGNANGSYPDNGGGGMNSNATLTNCRFIGNAAEYGGGAFSRGTLTGGTLTDCEFIGNFAEHGGGLICHGEVVNCTFIGNSARVWGGGVSGDAALTNCTFSGNSAGEAGGALLGCGTLINCIFSGNSAGEIGGAMYSYCYSCEGKMINCTFTGNSAGEYGGAMFLGDESDRQLLNCILWANTAPEGPQIAVDAVYAYGLAISYCNIQDGITCIYGHSDVQWGEGNIDADPCFVEPGYWDANSVWVEGDYHLLMDSVCINAGDLNYVAGPNETDLDGNPRVIGGRVDMGVYEFQGPSTWYIDGANGDDNNKGLTPETAFATIQKGIDMARNGDTVIVLDGIYTGDGNRDLDFDGKAIMVRSKNGPGNCIIDCDGTEADFHRGFYFHNEEDVNSIVDGFTITNGVHTTGGGILCTLEASPTIRNNIIKGNRIPYDWDGGGGIACRRGASPLIIKNIIQDNHCEPGSGGGGIHCYNAGSPRIIHNIVSGNSSSYGGGIEVAIFSDTAVIENNVIVGNTASSAAGIICWGTDHEVTIRNNTIAGNTAINAVGGIEVDSGIVTNCIIWDNRDSDGSDESAQIAGGSLAVNYCCIQGLTGALGGTGNIDTDPCFVEPGYWDASSVWVEGDYHLLKDSVCINAGDPHYVAEPNETDLDGKSRVLCGRIDMGAYEFHCPKAVYVDADATGNNDGSSWADAYNLLQDGLAAACEGDEIRVAQGIYKPGQGGGNTSGDREATFQLKNDVTIKGGYAGFGEPEPDARDIDLYETVLSGDLAGDDVGDLLDVSRAENSYHVVTGSGTDASAVLDGFTITSGNAFNTRCSSYDNGGGMYNSNGSPTVANCTFTRNTASDECGGGGAGMYNRYSNPTVISCEFVGNEYIIADDDGGGGMNNYRSNPTLIDCSFRDNKSNGDGGGMFNSRSNPTLTNCVFINNSCAHEGGGMENGNSSPALTYCSFINNSAYREGGGIRNGSWSSPVLIGCEFIGNSVGHPFPTAHSFGGGICNHYEDSPTLINCLFTGNSAQRGGGMYSYWGTASLVNCSFSGNSAADMGGAMYYRNVSSTLTNCIVWGNAALQGEEIYFEFYENPATMTVSYCDIKGGQGGIYVEAGNILNWGDGNIDSEPQFADSNNGNYRLSSGSPCVDAGDNDSVPPDVCDLDGNARIYDGDNDGISVVDMGAYELGLPPIEVSMKLVPQALNPGSQGKWIKAHFMLPEGFRVEDVDTSRPAEIEQFQLTSESMEVFLNKEDLVEVVAAFDRIAFCGIGPFEGEISVVGYLTSGRRFLGTDTIKIVTNKIKHLAVLAANWLSVCDAPDWCDGADLDQDSVVNFVDFALLDGCCFDVIKD